MQIGLCSAEINDSMIKISKKDIYGVDHKT